MQISTGTVFYYKIHKKKKLILLIHYVIYHKIAITLFVASVTSVVAASNVTYNVVSLQPSNQTIGVIVDNQVYPLTSVSKKSHLLHTGEAPAAASGYKYAVLDKVNTSNIVDQESFIRNPVTDDSTLNEYYGRSWNTMNLTQLPTIMDPLPIIDRIKSDLHIDGEIPTIHFTGNQSAIDYMHANQYANVEASDLTMTYIRFVISSFSFFKIQLTNKLLITVLTMFNRLRTLH
jgi:hypothetical protein